jgi:hypothetical protein
LSNCRSIFQLAGARSEHHLDPYYDKKKKKKKRLKPAQYKLPERVVRR